MKTDYETKSGSGTQKVELACGAQVVVSSTGPVLVLVNGFPQRAVFRLPDNYDSVEVMCDDEVVWTLRFAACKPRAEVLDPTPVAIPISGRIPESLEQTIARMVRSRVDQLAVQGGYDASDEEDFEDEDDEAPPTRFEYEEQAKLAERTEKAKRYVQAKRKEAREAAERRAAAAASPSTPPAPVAPTGAIVAPTVADVRRAFDLKS